MKEKTTDTQSEPMTKEAWKEAWEKFREWDDDMTYWFDACFEDVDLLVRAEMYAKWNGFRLGLSHIE